MTRPGGCGFPTPLTRLGGHMNNNLCFCGVLASDHHAWDCPYPFYGGEGTQVWSWYKDRERARIKKQDQ